jgi:predicted nucleic acid-binding protein
LLLGLPFARAAEPHVFDAPDGAAAPDLLNTEVLHVIRRYERMRVIDAKRSRDAAEILADLPIARYPTLSLLERAWGLRRNLTAYDAMYAALAEALGTPLVTTDARLASAVREHTRAIAVLLR